jgi:peptidoglycan/xylan/chitin deacetylase (PgdA/CDA1 family)
MRLLVLVLLLCFPADASARRWPSPAAGPSASGGPEVLFTFDDGPHEKYTGMVLDTLDAHGVQGIFYWVGRRVSTTARVREARIAVVERAVAEGHLVANHTINHVHLCKVPEDEAAAEIDGNRRLYEDLTGMPVSLFRAPYGNFCPRLVDLLAERATFHLHWDIDPREWEGRGAYSTARYVISRLRRLEGRAVVLMHDTKRGTARALPVILDWIADENRRREESGRPPIRILSGSDIVAERADLGRARWLRDTSRSAGASFTERVSRRVPGRRGPLTRR